MPSERDNVVQWVYASRNNQELSERYDAWAKSYDADLDADFGWVAPAIAVETALRFVPRDARILDAGAGTGLVGQLLVERGYHHLVALDLSQGMLDQARARKVYTDFHQMALGEPLALPSASFDAVISVGVFTVGHAPARSLDELVRVTRIGGHILFGMRPDVHETAGFKEKQDELEARGAWMLLEASDPVQVLPKGEPDVFHRIWVYRVGQGVKAR